MCTTIPFDYTTLFEYYKDSTPLWPSNDQIYITTYEKNLVKRVNGKTNGFEPFIQRSVTHCGPISDLSQKYSQLFPHGAFVCIIGDHSISKDMFLIFPEMLKDGNKSDAIPILVGNHFSYLIAPKQITLQFYYMWDAYYRHFTSYFLCVLMPFRS